jgi:ABC-type proline/glycine betaine transport system permease subunit
MGIKLLRFMSHLGKQWLMNVLMLFGFIFITTYFQWKFKPLESLLISLIGFIICGLVSLFLGPTLSRKLNIGF